MHRRTEVLLWLGVMVAAASAPLAYGAGRPSALPAVDGSPKTRATSPIPAESLGTWALRVIEQDPFRLARTPSRTPYGIASASTSGATPGPSLPELRLSGVVGPPWRAVIDGATAESGRVVAPGDSIAGAVVRDIRRESVRLRLGDTTWVINLPRP